MSKAGAIFYIAPKARWLETLLDHKHLQDLNYNFIPNRQIIKYVADIYVRAFTSL